MMTKLGMNLGMATFSFGVLLGPAMFIFAFLIPPRFKLWIPLTCGVLLAGSLTAYMFYYFMYVKVY